MPNAKVSNFITVSRQNARVYAASIETLRQMCADWTALYVGVTNDDEFVGNTDILTADGASYTATLAAMIGNAADTVTTFDALYRQNFERVA